VLRRQVWRYLSTGDAYAETKAALSLATARAWFPALQQQEDGLFKRSVPRAWTMRRFAVGSGSGRK